MATSIEDELVKKIKASKNVDLFSIWVGLYSF